MLGITCDLITRPVPNAVIGALAIGSRGKLHPSTANRITDVQIKKGLHPLSISVDSEERVQSLFLFLHLRLVGG